MSLSLIQVCKILDELAAIDKARNPE